jgi:hypothetical protein
MTRGIGWKLENLERPASLHSVLRPAVIASALLIAVAAAGCGGSAATKADFRQDVLKARNNTDAGLEQIVNATSVDDLLTRMKTAAVEVRGASTDLRKADAPKELEDERRQLADRLQALSDEIAGTVATLESFPDQAGNTSALNFEQWNAVQAELARLRKQGVDVPPLQRHKPEPTPQ